MDDKIREKIRLNIDAYTKIYVGDWKDALTTALAAVPEEYLYTVVLMFEPDEYYGSDINLYYTRDMSGEELAHYQTKEAYKLRCIEEQELRDLEILKAKYE